VPVKPALLTIDDAPSPRMREKVDFLKDRGIRAVWFCNGMHLAARPELALYAIQQGQILGNHAYEHPNFSRLTLEEGREQIRRTDDLLKELYAQVGVARPGKFFRFPYGDKGEGQRAAFQAYLGGLGYQAPAMKGITYRWYNEGGFAADLDWTWTYDSKDWALNRLEPVEGFENLDKVCARMDEDLPEEGRGLNHPGSSEIILMHDHERTTPYFYAIIERLEAKLQFSNYQGSFS
jgi:peptidoglycan-N-acetylglucosamine deacetylase